MRQDLLNKTLMNKNQNFQILDKIPPPPGFDRLPEDVRNKLKAIHRNKEKSWAQKQQELQAYIQSLPYEQRGLLMMGPQQVPKNMRGSQ
uniref:Uncharacterized protein n=2 Tax=Meloidogyne TaxID=189290 RepID=A0A6V7WFZ4_MELEN|nr:unnamed protein product [Meloidogyne enterolobii]CAD2191970.1 unnamed protein product [Meloidogyne enterolobii]CAD2201663.1 unnamed protein product [Meloidogyne enterolobii]